jgi:GNAT superfamily N-acetyltransferase
MEIRRATAADAPAIATVHVRSWQTAYRGLLPQRYLDELDPRRQLPQWEAVLDSTDWPRRGTFVLCAPADPPSVDPAPTRWADGGAGVVVGFASISPSRDSDRDPATVGELQTLYLHPDVWRAGGGSALLHAVEEEFGRAGLRSVTAWVLESNARARLFYERRGWRPDGTSKPHDWGTFVVTDVRYQVRVP